MYRNELSYFKIRLSRVIPYSPFHIEIIVEKFIFGTRSKFDGFDDTKAACGLPIKKFNDKIIFKKKTEVSD